MTCRKSLIQFHISLEIQVRIQLTYHQVLVGEGEHWGYGCLKETVGMTVVLPVFMHLHELSV